MISAALSRFVGGALVGALVAYMAFATIAIVRIVFRAITRRPMPAGERTGAPPSRIAIGCPLVLWVLAALGCGIVSLVTGGSNRSAYHDRGGGTETAADNSQPQNQDRSTNSADAGALIKLDRISV